MLSAERVEGDRETYRIEKMSEHDLLEVVEIEEACGLSRWGWDAYYAELEKPEAIMLVARRTTLPRGEEKRLSGYIATRLAAGEFHINNVGIRAGLRRRGIGGALLRTALRLAAREGARRAVLEVRAGNGPALALYKRFGFRISGRRPRYYRDPPEDALVMCARLEP